MKLLRHQEFISEQVFLNSINESRIYYSSKLNQWLSDMSNTDSIATSLTLIEYEDLDYADITLVDFAERPGYLTYTTEKNIKNNVKKFPDMLPDFDPEDNFLTGRKPLTVDRYYRDGNEVWKKSRNTIKVGALLNALLPNQLSPGQIEEFTNKIKAFQSGESDKVQVVQGEDIRKWYLEDNYLNSNEPLGTSCMRYARCQPYLDIYVKNPEVCKMVICLQGGKLVARALIWKISEKSQGDFEWYMDRRYYCIESYNQTLIDYAVKNNWAYKAVNSFTDIKSVVHNGSQFKCDMTIELDDKIAYRYYPYADTFKKYFYDTAILENDDNKYGSDFAILNTTSGSYTQAEPERDEDEYDEDNENMVWSDYQGEMLHIDDAVYVSRGRREGWYSSDSDYIVYCQDIDEYVHHDNAAYSDYHGEYIYEDNAVWVLSYARNNVFEGDYVSENDDQRVWIPNTSYCDNFWYKILESKVEDYMGILTKLLNKDWKGEWILKEYQVDTYCLTSEELEKLEIPRTHLIYLTKPDAEKLGLKIDENDKRIEDIHDCERTLLTLQNLTNVDYFDRLIEISTSEARNRMMKIKEKASV